MDVHRPLLADVSLWLPVCLLLAVATGFVDLRMRRFPTHPVDKYIPEVISGAAEAPGLYRVLAPFSIHWLTEASGAKPINVWHLTRLGWAFAAWVAMYAYLRTWFATGPGLLGTALACAVLPLTFTNSWAHPDHLPELALFTLGCLAAARRQDLLFGLTLVLASLNRETAVFLVPVYLAAHRWSREHLLRTASFGVLWFGVYAGLRIARGFQSYDPWQVVRNLDFLGLLPDTYDPYARAYAWFFVLLFAPLAYLALRSRRVQPIFVRRLPWVALPFVVVCCVFSSIIETRIFTPLLPLLLPGVMFALATTERMNDAPG